MTPGHNRTGTCRTRRATGTVGPVLVRKEGSPGTGEGVSREETGLSDQLLGPAPGVWESRVLFGPGRLVQAAPVAGHPS